VDTDDLSEMAWEIIARAAQVQPLYRIHGQATKPARWVFLAEEAMTTLIWRGYIMATWAKK